MNRITAILSLLFLILSVSFSAPQLISAGCNSLNVNPNPIVIGSPATFSSNLCESVDGTGSFTSPYWVDLIFKDNAGNSGIITAAPILLTVTPNPVGSATTSSVSFNHTFGPTVTISGGVGGPTLTLIDGEQYKLTARFWDANNIDAGASPEITVTFSGSGTPSLLSCTTFTPATTSIKQGENFSVSISGCTPEVQQIQVEVIDNTNSRVTYATLSTSGGSVTITIPSSAPIGTMSYKVILRDPLTGTTATWNPTNSLSVTAKSAGFWNRLTGSLIGVDCPPKMTYISIFDACLDFATTMSWGMNWALLIASLLALIRFAVGAVKLITSTGDPSKLQDGRETLTDAILGLVLLATAWIIFGYLNSTFPEEWQIDLFSLFG